MPILINPTTGEIGVSDDPTGALQQGWRIATDDEADAAARRIDFGSFEQQAQAQVERVVRGGTLGAIEGIGLPEDITARAEVSEELSPVTSALASIAPDIGVAALTGGIGGLATGAGRLAARTALAEGAGLVRAGLAAGRAGGAAALAGESLGTAAVGAGQMAYAEGRELGDDPGRDAENALIWGGLNFGLGAAMGQLGRRAGGELAEESLDDIAKAAEHRAAGKAEATMFEETATPGVPGQIYDVEGAAPPAPTATPPGGSIDDLSRQFNEITGLTPKQAAGGAALGGAAVLGAEGETEGAAGAAAGGLALVLGTAMRGKASPAVLKTLDDVSKATDDAVKRLTPEERQAISNWSSSSRYIKEAFERDVRTPEDQIAKLEKLGYKRDDQIARQMSYGRTEEEAIQRWNDRVEGPYLQTGDQDTIDAMRGALDKLSLENPTQYGPLYRGFGAGDVAYDMATIDSLRANDTFVAKTPLSTSFNPAAVEDFAETALTEQGQTPVFLQFQKVNRAAPRVHPDLQPLSTEARNREAEVIIPQGSTFRVVNREKVMLKPRKEIASFTAPKEADIITLEQIEDAPREAWKNAAMIAAMLGVGAAAEGEEGAALAGAGGLGLFIGKGRLIGKAMRQGEREAVEGGVERALHRASKAEADDIVERAIGKAPEREADSFGRQRRLYINRAAVLDVAERELSKDVGGLMKDVEQVARADKQAAISQHVAENLPAQKAAVKTISQDAAKFAGELRAEARAYAKASGKNGIQYPISGAKDLNLALLDHASAAAKAKTPRQMFEALDTFKRTLQDLKLTLEQGAANADNAIHHQRLIPRIDTFERKIRTALEDSATWGKAGEMQRSYNAVLSDKLFPSLRIFEEAVLQRTHRGYDGVWNLEGWETKARKLLKNADPGKRRHVAAVLDGMDELASVRRQYGDGKLADRIEAQTAKVRRTLGLADEVHDATERMQALGTLAGAVPLIGGTTRAAVMGDLTAAFQRLSGASEAAAQRGVDDWIKSSRVRGTGRRGLRAMAPELTGEAKQLRDIAVRRGVSTAMLLFLGDDETPGAAFERWRDALLDQEKFFEEIGADFGTLQQEYPEAYMALSARADLARRFLLQRMPPNVAVSMANPEGYPPSNAAIEDWAQYVNAVRFPTRVVQELAAISVQEAETLRTVHPRLYEIVQQRIIEGIASAQQAGEPLDDTFLARVGILFPELDGVGSPVFSREFGEAVRAHNQLQREMRAATAGGRSSPRRPQQPNPLQATIGAGATFGTLG